jgi:ribonuclease PH/non-canonical purine NTP pyrophosphatase (RdgB/HAM1 family)
MYSNKLNKKGKFYMYRPSKREKDELRQFSIEPDYMGNPEGSCMVKAGNTHVLCVATVEKSVPMFLRGTGKGWVTAEYGMLPRSTDQRMRREAAIGKQSGRTLEIQRLIGRSLRAIIDMDKLNEYQIKIDCDVIRADGGTRTAAISGAYVALSKAVDFMLEKGIINENPIYEQVAAVSCGIFKGEPVLDLDFYEDSNAQADSNFVLTASGKIIEVQGTAEKEPFSKSELMELLSLAEKGVSEIAQEQNRALKKGANRRKFKPGDEIIIATHNMGKFKEFKNALAPYTENVLSGNDINLPDVEETEETFEGNAKLKAIAGAKHTGKIVIADDSGFCVKKLKGKPGVYSKRFAVEVGNGKENYPAAIAKLNEELGNNKDRRASFCCCLVIAWPDGHTETLNGRVNGKLLKTLQGEDGFGFDPAFVPNGHDRTFAEMSLEEKQKLSHRGKALSSLIEEVFEK